MKDMNQKIGVGVLWNLASILVSHGASAIFTLFLARFLAPEAFGLIAMVTVCFQVAGVVVESGIGQALIRSKHVTEVDLSTAFFANLGFSALAYAGLYFAAPLVAAFYNQPELTVLVQVMGLVVFLNAAQVVQRAVLSRAMNFKVMMKAGTLAVLVSGVVALGAAYGGAGVWSLVLQMLVSTLVSTAVLWLASGWRPRLVFDFEAFRSLFQFGRNLLAAGMLAVLFENSYILVIGRFFSAELTGLYFFAGKISNLISRSLTSAVQQATFPALATLQEDNARLRHKYRQIVQLMMFLIAPVMLILAGLASPLFSMLFDERWQSAVPYMQVLCLVGALYPLHALNINILNVKGRSDLILKLEPIKKSVSLILLFAAIPFGVFGIAVSQVIGSVLALGPNTYFSAKLIGYNLSDQLIDIFKPVTSAALAAFASWVLTVNVDLPPWLLFLVASFVGVIIYLMFSFIFKSEGSIVIAAKVKDMYLRNKATV